VQPATGDSSPGREPGGAAPQPPGAGGKPSKGLEGFLLDISEGGFALAQNQPVEPGSLIRFSLHLGKRMVTVSGRVLTRLAFREGNWLLRCEMRGLSSAQANQLGLLMRQELKLRLEGRKRALKHPEKPESD